MRKRAARVQVEVHEPSHAAQAAALIGRHPRESVGLFMAVTATIAIFANAMFLQKGPHPAPIFATRPLLQPATAARPQVAIAPPAVAPSVEPMSQTRADLIAEIQRELSRKGFYEGAADGVWGARTDNGVREFIHATGAKIAPEASEGLLRALVAAPGKRAEPARTNDPIAALIAPSSRVAAIQRALADFGYGQLKPTGVYDPETRVAIEKFERDHRLPVTGQISDRFVRALSGMTGRPLE